MTGPALPHVTLVPTPVGNLGDLTLRAIEVLKTADAVACEDTRRSGALLRYLGIHKPLVRLDAHTLRDRAPGTLEKYPRLAYVSDAGTPGISDPGAELLTLALSLGGTAEVLPGATAFVPALVLSGLSTARFTFEGFLPRSGRERRERLSALARRQETSILYESPHRLAATLGDLTGVCGEARRGSVTRELSKLHEETRRGTLGELAQVFSSGARGEIVVVIEGAPEPSQQSNTPSADFHALARQWAREGKSSRDIRQLLVAAGLRKNDAYALSLAVTNPDEPTGAAPSGA
ncbi:16S rRNA (cytidine(1402)-2'-O)-methyltransferase [Deinococcus peraridilitoris]|uniref:Ribosomal RNA small subunit methyltransferase I n=1 Tax=Deinococcus peraridilitoris (strain DSM 19664 / LMG 22246 / CIP 109416 / KR-200) TaxID=937777 RepID=L0A0M0_DEIPD|nr:16S rRNA (cytidine(1402)-2'-O)-methyltransferase [Deinococcus peraridilitoris]AFZ67391.1 putative S-adenosylmethionine-dependent methyltransferase, YraL family [Deinococcus peraridilitoris DSM 19664]